MLKKKYRVLATAAMLVLAAMFSGCSATAKKEHVEENEIKEEIDTVDKEADSDASGLVFHTQDIYGKTVTEAVFQDYDLTLVNIFATWCSPCIAEMPELAKLDETMEEKGVNVVAVCIDALNNRGELDLNAIALVQQIAEISEAKFQFLVPDATLFGGRLANVQAVPESFFVDRNGNLVGEPYVGARDLAAWTQIVEQELDKVLR